MTYLQTLICREVARAFKIPYAKIRNNALEYFETVKHETDIENHPVIEFNLEDIGKISFIATKNTATLFSFFDFEKLKKTSLYSDILDGFINHNVDFVVAVLNGEVFAIKEEFNYRGFGGLVFGDNEKKYTLAKLRNLLVEDYAINS